jgi:hypothetical protein
MRLYTLAYQLDVPTEAVFAAARRLGIDVRNSLSSISTEQQAAIEKVLGDRPPEEPPLGVNSKLRPRGPGPGSAAQRLPLPEDDGAE